MWWLDLVNKVFDPRIGYFPKDYKHVGVWDNNSSIISNVSRDVQERLNLESLSAT
jgi:hypothetical protein